MRSPRLDGILLGRALISTLLGLTFAASAVGEGLPAAEGAWTPDRLWQAWPEARFVATSAPCLSHAELTASLQSLAKRHTGRVRLEEAGRSFQDRSIHMLTLGQGPRKVMLWSQMHGDEPSATPALLDLADFLLTQGEEPAARSILDELTLLIVPMVNPDGSEVYQRLNSQGIDVNRDALNLVTPEGRLLKRLRDEHEPILGFNLHDQNRRTAVGDTGVLATNAVLAVAGDAAGTLTPGRLRAKRACAAIVAALAPLVPGGMARYDEDWSPRAFGDNLTAWGMPVVLIESGGVPAGLGFHDLTRLNFVALVTVLQDLARDDLAGHDPQVYEHLKRNQSDAWVDVAVRGAKILQPGTETPYRADLTFQLQRDDRYEAGCSSLEPSGSSIFEIGDARFAAAGREVDAESSLILAPFVVEVEGWPARHWLDAPALERLARSGVGEVRWMVKRRRLLDAMDLADELAGPGRSRLQPGVSVSPSLTRLDHRPAEPRSDSLADVLATLGSSPSLESIGRLWPQAGQALPGIRRRTPASFLLVTAGPEDGLDLAASRLVGVWLDGVEVGR